MIHSGYNIYYIVVALGLIVLMGVLYYRKRSFDMHLNTMFFVLLVITMIGILFDLATAISFSADPFDRTATLVLCSFFFTFHASMPFVFACYILFIVGEHISAFSLKEMIALFLPEIVILLLVVTNFFTGCLFSIDSTGVFTRNPLIAALYVFVLYYIILGIARLMNSRVMPIKDVFILMATFIGLCTITTVLGFIYPHILLESYCTALVLLMLVLTLQLSSLGIDPILDIFNIRAFSSVLPSILQEHRKTTAIIIYLEDLKLLISLMGIDKINIVLRSIAYFLNSLVDQHVYYLETGTFVMLIPNNAKINRESILAAIDNRFCRQWEYGNNTIFITYRRLELSLPEEVCDFETFYSYLNYLRSLDNSCQWRLLAKDINLTDTRRQTAVSVCIKSAIENAGFQVFYQPVVSAVTGRIVAAEALLRLPDSNYGFIPPGEFIPIAEKNGTILKISEFLQESVFRFMHGHLADLGLDFIELNLSVIQGMQDKTAEQILRRLDEFGISQRNLCLDVSESAVVNSPKMLVRNMLQLHDTGIRFALDDYGTGYSSVSSLIELPLDIIKFDKSMLDSGFRDDKGKLVLGSSIAMIKKMNLDIVAEGIETKQQADSLRHMKIDGFQGFYFSRALPEDMFVKFCKDRMK